MDQNERQIIEELFSKLRRVETQAPPRDPEAEALIRQRLAEQPGAPYYMAQAIVVQEQALAAAQSRIEALKRQLAERPAGGFLGGLFGGGASARTSAPPAAGVPGDRRPAFGAGAPFAGGHGHSGGGFLAGAMQTALGVAGGMLVASALTSLLAPDAAAAAEPAPAEEPLPEEEERTAAWGESGWDGEAGMDDTGGEEF